MGNCQKLEKQQKKENCNYFDNQQQFKELIINSNLEPMSKYENNNSVKNSLETKTSNKKIQAYSLDSPNLISNSQEHGFIEAIRNAYSYHIPLILSPDMIWCLIMQRFSKHVEKNSKKLRKRFVNFDGKKTLTVYINNFTFGQQNNWQEVFPQFSQQIKSFIGKKNHKNMVSEFSTTTALEKSICELQLMDSMKNYFVYRCMTMCGMTKVKLLGTLEDWNKLKKQTENLAQYDFKYWTKYIIPILDKFIEAYNGKVDETFWNTIYKKHHRMGSGGGTSVNGWICNFMSLDKLQSLEDIENYYKSKKPAFEYVNEGGGKMSIGEIPNGVAKTPFEWHYLGKKYDMNFISGFAGAHFDGEYIKPILSWAVAENDSKNESENNSEIEY